MSLAVALVVSCGGDSGGRPSVDGSASGGAGCPLTLTEGGTTYSAVSCVVQGAKTFAAGVYQVVISAPFNRITSGSDGKIRSVQFVLTDDDASTETHVKTFPVSTANPSVKATYKVSQTDDWSSLAGAVNVGSGSFVVSEYDRAAKRISGSYEIVVKQGDATKTITGTLTHVPMLVAE